MRKPTQSSLLMALLAPSLMKVVRPDKPVVHYGVPGVTRRGRLPTHKKWDQEAFDAAEAKRERKRRRNLHAKACGGSK